MQMKTSRRTAQADIAEFVRRRHAILSPECPFEFDSLADPVATR
ncbi:MAG: hypothetical protein P1U37_01480 [Minwuia sp.]|nr:hypothetical protein [Minwuia sp.]